MPKIDLEPVTAVLDSLTATIGAEAASFCAVDSSPAFAKAKDVSSHSLQKYKRLPK